MAQPGLQSKAERAFTHDGIQQDIRADGRRREDFRNMLVELGPIATVRGACEKKHQ